MQRQTRPQVKAIIIFHVMERSKREIDLRAHRVYRDLSMVLRSRAW